MLLYQKPKVRTFQIDLGPDDISLSYRGSNLHCAIARAVRRTTGIVVLVAATGREDQDGLTIWEVCTGDVMMKTLADLPPEAARWAERFDQGDLVGPISFNLEMRA